MEGVNPRVTVEQTGDQSSIAATQATIVGQVYQVGTIKDKFNEAMALAFNSAQSKGNSFNLEFTDATGIKSIAYEVGVDFSAAGLFNNCALDITQKAPSGEWEDKECILSFNANGPIRIPGGNVVDTSDVVGGEDL